MTYPVNPTDPTTPTDDDPAAEGAAEFRALKAYIQGLIPFPGGMNFLRKNFIINGDMSIDQRNEGQLAIITHQTATYGADRFVGYCPVGCTADVQRVVLGTGSALNYDVTVAHTALATELVGIETAIEGLDSSFLSYGTAAAKVLSLSFSVIAPLIGTYAIALRNSATNRSYVATYNVPVANQETSITINNILGDITGAWAVNSTLGIDIFFDLGSGTNYETNTINAWQAGNFLRTSTCVQISTAVQTVTITNVQLEQSAAATAFEYLHFTNKELLCRRYYWKTFPHGTKPVGAGGNAGAMGISTGVQNTTARCQITFNFPVSMRATVPVMTYYSPHNNTGVPYDDVSGLDAGTFATLSGLESFDRVVMYMTLPNSNPPNEGAVWLVHATANGDFW